MHMEIATILVSIFTFIYLALVIYIFFKKKKENINLLVIGGYWGGVISPLPLIWLALGYFSQMSDAKEYKEFTKIQTLTNNITIDFIKKQSEIIEQSSKPNFKFLDSSTNNIDSSNTEISLHFLNTGAPIFGFQLFKNGKTLSKSRVINNWKTSEGRKILLWESQDLKYYDDKEIEYTVKFTNMHGFEKEYVLIFNRKANFLYKDNNTSHYDIPTATASILPINEQRKNK